MLHRSVPATATAVALALLAAVALSPGAARADTTFSATLDGAQEVPPVVTPATGSGTVVLNDAETQALVSLSFSGLIGTETEAHIHGPAPAGVDAPIILTLPLGNFTDFVWNLTATDVQNLKDGLLYFNVHSTVEPGGEIRGQIEPPPVGGIVELNAGGGLPRAESTVDAGSSSAGLYVAVAVAVVAVTAGAGARYARRRWTR